MKTTESQSNCPDPTWDYADIYLRLQSAISTLKKIEADIAACESATDDFDQQLMNRLQSLADLLINIKHSM